MAELTLERLAELEHQLRPQDDENDHVCHRCGAGYHMLDLRNEPSALCDSCAQEFVEHDAPELLAAARRLLELEQASEFLAQSARRACLVTDYRAPGEATFDVRVRAIPQVARLLGWPGIESGKGGADV